MLSANGFLARCRNPWTVLANFIELKIGVYFFVQVIFKKYDCRFSKQISCTASFNNSDYARTVSVTFDHTLQGLLFHEYVFLMEAFSMDICMIFKIVHHYLKIAYLEVGNSKKLVTSSFSGYQNVQKICFFRHPPPGHLRCFDSQSFWVIPKFQLVTYGSHFMTS